jgi:outer membrane protein TolC
MVSKRALAVPFFLLVLAVFPDYSFSAETPLSEKPGIAAQQSGVQIDNPATNILTLDQCIELALQNNPVLQIEREKIIELENDYRIASSGLYPKLTASAYYARVNRDRVGIQPAMQYTEESLGQLKLKQLLFDGGKTTNNGRAAEKAAEAQRQSTEGALLDTVYVVSQAYFRVHEARELVRVGENSRSQREAFFKLTDSFLKAGKASRLEALKAEAQLLDAERILIQAREALGISVLILKKTMGIGVQAPIDIGDGLPETFSEPGNEELLLSEMIQNNPDLKKSAGFKDQARLSIDSATGSYLPEISLQGIYGYRERDVGMPPTAGDEWLGGVFLEWSLLEGGLTRAQVGKARARYRETEWNARGVRDQVQVDFRQALADIKTSLASIKASKRLVEAQDEAYKAAVEFYKRGKSTYIEVLTAETDLTQAKASYVRAVGDYQSASARLDRVVGKRYSANGKQEGWQCQRRKRSV